MSVKILIVDDHGILREGLELLVNQQKDMQVIGQAGNGLEAIKLAKELKPDLIVMDVVMPELNGIEATRQIVEANSGIKVLVLTAHLKHSFIADMLRAGACGYILKGHLQDELIKAIRTVMSGQMYFCSKAANALVDDYVQSGTQERVGLDTLTGKERHLVQIFAEGKTSKEAALLFNRSDKTIDAMRRVIMSKLDISSVAELTKFAVREGLTSVNF
jgi:DNA-binding NarL/FixJ family response regulator